MEEDTRDKKAGLALNAEAGPNAAEAPTKLPPGVVLGKDGKPCRSCSSHASFAAWASQTKSSLRTSTSPSSPAPKDSSVAVVPSDCPADVETLGRSTWTLLHSIAATYPSRPTATEQADIQSFMKLFSRIYPCWVCAEDFQSYVKSQPIRAGTRDEFGNWLCEAHNEVNRKLGKPTFDCSRWQERWRTGWKDGRCD